MADAQPTQLEGLQHHPAADLFPMLAGEELQDLADDIRANGLHEPIWLYQDPEHGLILLDGRNRLAACKIAGVEPKTRRYLGDDPIGFSVSLNVKRRHLTVGQKAALALEVAPLYEAEAERRKAEAAARENRRRAAERIRQDESLDVPVRADLPEPEPKPEVRARDRAASTIQGVSGRAVGQMKRVAAAAPDLAEKVKSGELALDRAERIVRDRAAEERRREQALAEAAMTDETTVDIRHGDFREVLADLDDVDAIITDPPYPHEFIPLLADLAAWADKVLKPDGILAVLMGQTYLPEVYRLLDGHRPYRWTGAYLTPGAGYASMKARVQSNWKPLIIYGGGPRFSDTITTAVSTQDTARERHKWGQDYTAFHEIVRRLTSKGQTVVDPFMGSGTTLLAAKTQGRHAIGCDTDAAHVESARKWLA